ncbi:MAG: ATP-binding protein, partial [Pseudomonadota bacterium]
YRLRLLSLMICLAAWFFCVYEIYFPESIVPRIYLLLTLAVAATVPTVSFISLPIKVLSISCAGIQFNYHLPHTGPFYSLYAGSMLIFFIYSNLRVLKLKSLKFSKAYGLLSFVPGVVGGLNDFAVTHNLISTVMVSEYLTFAFLISVYILFFREQQQDHLLLQKLNITLEDEVQERIHDLTLANEQLHHEIEDRKRAEEEKKILEQHLQRSEKMETIGLLAGGVAHDLNNMLGAIVGYPELLLDDLPKDSPLRPAIKAIQDSGNRAAAIVQDLLTLTRRGTTVSEITNLNAIVRKYFECREFEIIKEYHPGIMLKQQLDQTLLNIVGSPVHLSKVIANLVSNAAEAMPNGGTIEVVTKNIYLDAPLKGYDNIAEGDYVVLSVSDNGIGIAEEDLQRIFEPFYTKKVMGRSGTGLGMSVVWGSMKDHSGYIDIASIQSEGTTITLYFPATREKCKEQETVFSIEGCVGNGETIVVVDDVEAQLDIAKAILTKLRYRVETVSGGEKAVEFLKQNNADLFVIDMIMDPGIDGLETYRKILELRPQQKAIIASGYSETDRVKQTQILGAGAYVKKPYTIEKLGQAVKKELCK